MALGSGLAVARATSSNASVSCAAKSTWMTDTEGFRSVRACKKARCPLGARLVSTGQRMRRRTMTVPAGRSMEAAGPGHPPGYRAIAGAWRTRWSLQPRW